MATLFPLPAPPAVPVIGDDRAFPVHRVFCVGRNYEAHAREMGFSANREAPIWFTKAPAAVCLSGATIPYPPGTGDCHYEMELVVHIGADGFRVAAADAPGIVFGYGCGLDMTRRDLQAAARDKGLSWDTGKDFENAAVLGPITPAERFGAVAGQRIMLTQNGAVRQDSVLCDMIWNVADLIADLSTMYHLRAGDVVFTGTPAGVGPVAPGDMLKGTIDGLEPVELGIGPAQ